MASPREAIAAAAARLAAAGVPSPEFDAAELLAHAWGCERRDLARHRDVPADVSSRFEASTSRREQREPLQHITGVAYFRHLALAVGPGVFIPRPETETVAQVVIDECLRLTAPVVVDLGSGSGAIAIAVATEVPQSSVHAVEVDPGAYVWTQRNVHELAPHIDVRIGNLESEFADLSSCVDVVVSNPPYIPPGSVPVDPEVRDYDPQRALYGSGPDGLDEVRAVVGAAARLLRPGGLLVIEHADAQGTSAPAVLVAAGGWDDVRDHRDLAGRARFVTGRLR